MDALYRGYCGMGTSTPSRESRIIALSAMRTATLAPSVRKMFCGGRMRCGEGAAGGARGA
jgi:hypothetical protein